MKTVWASGPFRMPKTRIRVVPGFRETMATLRPKARLRKVDLPTLGRPTMATNPAFNPKSPLKESMP